MANIKWTWVRKDTTRMINLVEDIEMIYPCFIEFNLMENTVVIVCRDEDKTKILKKLEKIGKKA
jgi:hypothetical protein